MQRGDLEGKSADDSCAGHKSQTAYGNHKKPSPGTPIEAKNKSGILKEVGTSKAALMVSVRNLDKNQQDPGPIQSWCSRTWSPNDASGGT